MNSPASFVADNISAMLAYWDKDLICRYANAAYLDWFGRTGEEMINRITLNELLGPKLFELNYPHIMGALNGTPQTFEREIPLPSGQTKFALANYYPDIKDGQTNGFIVHVADVTSVKELEAKLITSNEIISEQNKKLLNFSNIISHNLKSYSTNLASVLSLFEHADSEEEKAEMFTFLKSISNQFSSTITHLNELTKTQNQASIPAQNVNLNAFILKIINTLQIQIKESGAVIKNEVNSDISLMANSAYLESILLNFISNAIKYKHESRFPVITISCNKTDSHIILSINDNGKGINLEKFGSKIFGMYQTFHGNDDAQGLGLFIAKYQIEAMGGNVQVESQENIGTTFTIYFQST